MNTQLKKPELKLSEMCELKTLKIDPELNEVTKKLLHVPTMTLHVQKSIPLEKFQLKIDEDLK